MISGAHRLVQIVLLAALAGCVTADRTEPRTSGLTLEILQRLSPTAAALYRVEQDGTLAFGGGSAAQQGRTSWSGPLTDAEIAELRRLVEMHAWLEREPSDVEDGSGTLYEVFVRGPRGRQRFKVHGGTPGVAEVATLLDTAARRRLASDLEVLPRPSGEGGDP